MQKTTHKARVYKLNGFETRYFIGSHAKFISRSIVMRHKHTIWLLKLHTVFHSFPSFRRKSNILKLYQIVGIGRLTLIYAYPRLLKYHNFLYKIPPGSYKMLLANHIDFVFPSVARNVCSVVLRMKTPKSDSTV